MIITFRRGPISPFISGKNIYFSATCFTAESITRAMTSARLIASRSEKRFISARCTVRRVDARGEEKGEAGITGATRRNTKRTATRQLTAQPDEQ